MLIIQTLNSNIIILINHPTGNTTLYHKGNQWKTTSPYLQHIEIKACDLCVSPDKRKWYSCIFWLKLIKKVKLAKSALYKTYTERVCYQQTKMRQFGYIQIAACGLNKLSSAESNVAVTYFRPCWKELWTGHACTSLRHHSVHTNTHRLRSHGLEIKTQNEIFN